MKSHEVLTLFHICILKLSFFPHFILIFYLCEDELRNFKFWNFYDFYLLRVKLILFYF